MMRRLLDPARTTCRANRSDALTQKKDSLASSMRTTLDIDVVLLRKLRAEAERRGVPFKDVVTAALRRGLADPAAPKLRKPYGVASFSMGPPRAGVNLDKALA